MATISVPFGMTTLGLSETLRTAIGESVTAKRRGLAGDGAGPASRGAGAAGGNGVWTISAGRCPNDPHSQNEIEAAPMSEAASASQDVRRANRPRTTFDLVGAGVACGADARAISR